MDEVVDVGELCCFEDCFGVGDVVCDEVGVVECVDDVGDMDDCVGVFDDCGEVFGMIECVFDLGDVDLLGLWFVG